jgi:beta-lactamase regulating signal transducer with metallopeptidase domain
MPLLDHLVFSVAANLATLVGVLLLRSASPRLVLNVCLAGMLMVAVPWAPIGERIAATGAHPAGVALSMAVLRDAAPAAGAGGVSVGGSWPAALVAVWLAVSACWLSCTFLAAARTRRRWRALAVPGEALRVHALEGVRALAERVDIHRVPGSRMAVATGMIRREIWIGDALTAERQIAVALNHELCHLQAGDQYVIHLVTVLERLLWWNPVTWILGGLARRHLEYACDRRCARCLGPHLYRGTLAEMVLDRMPNHASATLTIGSPSGVVDRMERLTMTCKTRIRHVIAIAGVGAGIVLGSGALAADPQQPTLIACNDRLPEGVSYRLVIKSELDTRNGDAQGEIGVTLLDNLKPESVEVPEGAGPYARCVLDLLGVPEEEYPEGV